MTIISPQFDIDLDVREFVGFAKLADKALERGAVKALNNIAFQLRKETPAILEASIDRPTPFTLLRTAIHVHKASSSQEGAILSINRLQSQYLGILEYGGVKRNGIRGALSQGNRAIDAHGNIRNRFRRNSSFKEMIKTETIKVSHRSRNADGTAKRDTKGRFEKAKSVYEVKRFFIGRLKNGRNPNQVGLWERGRDNRTVRLVADYFKSQSYQPGQLGLHKAWDRNYEMISEGHFYDALNRELEKARKTSKNRKR